MLSFDFKKSSRKCSKSDREFQPGETFYSELVEAGDGTERRDYSQENWQGPDEDSIGWWKSQVPELNKGKVYWAPKNILLAYFDHIKQNEACQDLTYVTALLLVQKKIFTLMDDGGDSSHLFVKNRSDKNEHVIPVIEVSPERLQEIQAELSERLFMDEPVDSNESDLEDA